jgi:hypothetical protein
MTQPYPNWNPDCLRMREQWMVERSRQDTDWAYYVQRDEDGMVHASPLLSGMVSTWASQVMEAE